jgi:hypothetical protein
MEIVDNPSIEKIKNEIFVNRHCFSDLRAQAIDFHKYTKNISLRYPVCAPNNRNRIFNRYHCFINGIESAYTKDSESFPVIKDFLENFAHKKNVLLGRAQVVLLVGESEVSTHVDYGYYYALHDRYHLVIESEGSKMVSGKETAVFKKGDLFFYENRIPHSASNTGESERMHIIFDVMPTNPLVIVYKFFKWKLMYKKYIDFSLFKDSGYFFNNTNSSQYLLEALKLSLKNFYE